MKAYNIDWDTDEQETADDMLERYTIKEIADILKVKLEEITNHKVDDFYDFIYDFICDQLHHRPGLMDDFYKLPNSVEIPEKVLKDIADRSYDSCQSCSHYSNCNICSDCDEGSEYEFNLRCVNDEYITDWLSDEYGFCINGYQLDTDTE